MPCEWDYFEIKELAPNFMKYLYTSFISLHLLHTHIPKGEGNNSGNDPHYLGGHMPRTVRRIPFH